MPKVVVDRKKSPGKSSGERQVAKLERELAHVREDLSRAKQLASLGTAAAMFAHEFNNAMTPIVGYAQFALDSGDPELMAKGLRTTLKQTESVLKMTERILGLAVDAPDEFEPVAIGELVLDASDCMGRDWSKDGITLNVDIDAKLRVHGNRHLLRHVFFNLFLNARHALEGQSGKVTVSAEEAGDKLIRIFVKDNGPGIPAKHIDSIFDAFFTTKTGRSGGHKGTGLGLTFCREIAEQHGGTIEVSRSSSKGTEFTLSLPAAK